MADQPADYASCTPDGRCAAIDELAGLTNAMHGEILQIVAAADRAEDWKADGATSMVDWLACRYKLAPQTARDWVRAAHALEQLPELRQAYLDGAVSFDQIRHAARFATPDDDGWLAGVLPAMNAAQVKALAQARNRITDRQAGEANRRRRLRLLPDPSGLGSRVAGFLPTEQAAAVDEALRRRAEAMGPDTETGLWDPYDSRCADALADLCGQDLATAAHDSAHPDASLVVIHVAAEVDDDLSEHNGSIDGQPITATAVRRRLCDTQIEFNIDAADGRTVGIGRRSRTIPPWLRRRIVTRDNHSCRWPACSRPVRHIHHMRHWTRGGPTDATNLIAVCWHHHHLLHEGGWTASGDADAEISISGPHGHTVNSRAGPVAA